MADHICHHERSTRLISHFSHIAKRGSSLLLQSLLFLSHTTMLMLCSSLCNRYQTPECDGAARSRVSDTEDPFQGRDLTGFPNFLEQT